MTATPKNTIHQSTYTFFDMKNNIPTDVYEYEEAVEKDHVLVPFYLIETSTQISDDGITYADLTRKRGRHMKQSLSKMEECLNIFRRRE